MPKIINISFYGAPGEKNLNQNVAMRSEETCPDCVGSGGTGKFKEVVDVDSRSIEEHEEPCHRCHGDGKLTNLIEFCPEAPACACNEYPLGTWLRIMRMDEIVECKQCDKFTGFSCMLKSHCQYSESSIIVIVTDRMASWLNSDGGKWSKVCNKCHSRSNGYAGGTCICRGTFVKTRDLDLTYGAFALLAPHSVGLIQAEVSAWKGGKWE